MKFIGNQMITGPGGQREKYELKEKTLLVVTYKGGETGKPADYFLPAVYPSSFGPQVNYHFFRPANLS